MPSIFFSIFAYLKCQPYAFDGIIELHGWRTSKDRSSKTCFSQARSWLFTIWFTGHKWETSCKGLPWGLILLKLHTAVNFVVTFSFICDSLKDMLNSPVQSRQLDPEISSQISLTKYQLVSKQVFTEDQTIIAFEKNLIKNQVITSCWDFTEFTAYLMADSYINLFYCQGDSNIETFLVTKM